MLSLRKTVSFTSGTAPSWMTSESFTVDVGPSLGSSGNGHGADAELGCQVVRGRLQCPVLPMLVSSKKRHGVGHRRLRFSIVPLFQIRW